MLRTLAVINFFIVFIYTVPMLAYFGVINLLGYLFRSKKVRLYSMNNLVAPDQWWNSALMGEEDETVSSRLGRAVKSGRPKPYAKAFAMFVNLIFRVIAGQKNHVLESIEERYLAGAPSDEQWNFIKNV